MEHIFLQVSLLLGLTVGLGFIMRLFRQPLLSAYLVAGILAGPFFLNVLSGKQDVFEILSQFGVVLLLFMVGLSLSMDHLKKIGKTSLIVALIQVLFTSLVGYGILRWLGFQNVSAWFLAIAMTFSSTIIIVKLLTDKKETETIYGRHVFGLMVVQDIIAIVIMMFVTSIGNDGVNIATVLSGFAVKLVILIAVVYFLSKFLLPKLMDNIAKSGEFLFLFTIAWCFGIGSLLHWLGFSIEIGAIIAGLSLGSSPYQQEIMSRIKPLRDFFIVLFFIILGSQMSLANLEDALGPAIILSIFILLGNSFILFRAFRALKFTRRNSFLAGLTAAQVSEFGFVLLTTVMAAGYVTNREMEVFTIVALITIFFSSYAITFNSQMYRLLLPFFQLFGKDRQRQKEEKPVQYDVWVFGYHRLGWKICEGLQEKGVSFAVVDFNPAVLIKLKQRGIPAYYGDVADIEFLETLALDKAKMIISTIPDPDDELTLVKHTKEVAPKARVIATLYHTQSLDEMYASGVDYVMLPHLLGGTWMSDILRDAAWTKKTFVSLRAEQIKEMQLRLVAETVR